MTLWDASHWLVSLIMESRNFIVIRGVVAYERKLTQASTFSVLQKLETELACN